MVHGEVVGSKNGELVMGGILEGRGFPNVQFYTKCAVLIPICAVLTANLCSSHSSHYLI